MKVHFVRHGHSVLNDLHVHQSPETPLSEKGIKQAELIAERFRNIPIELILTSPYTRAVQTAEEIHKTNQIPLIQTELLIERVMPSSFLGKSVNDPEIVSTHQLIRDHFEDPGWHFADEENFHDLIERVKKFIKYLHSQNKNTYLVVTHGYFLTLLVCYFLFEDRINYSLFKQFNGSTELVNTGITLCTYDDQKWKLINWNDDAHLGEVK